MKSMAPVWDYIRLRRRADGKGKPLTNEYWESTEHIPPSGILEIKPLLHNQGNECEEHEILGAHIRSEQPSFTKG